MSRMTKERRANLEKLADEDPHMCLLRELLNEIDAQEAEVAALRRQVEERRIIVPPISPEEWEDLQRRHRSPLGAIRHEEILHGWIVRHVRAVGSDEMVVKRADWEARAPSADTVTRAICADRIRKAHSTGSEA